MLPGSLLRRNSQTGRHEGRFLPLPYALRRHDARCEDRRARGPAWTRSEGVHPRRWNRRLERSPPNACLSRRTRTRPVERRTGLPARTAPRQGPRDHRDSRRIVLPEQTSLAAYGENFKAIDNRPHVRCRGSLAQLGSGEARRPRGCVIPVVSSSGPSFGPPLDTMRSTSGVGNLRRTEKGRAAGPGQQFEPDGPLTLGRSSNRAWDAFASRARSGKALETGQRDAG